MVFSQQTRYAVKAKYFNGYERSSRRAVGWIVGDFLENSQFFFLTVERGENPRFNSVDSVTASNLCYRHGLKGGIAFMSRAWNGENRLSGAKDRNIGKWILKPLSESCLPIAIVVLWSLSLLPHGLYYVHNRLCVVWMARLPYLIVNSWLSRHNYTCFSKKSWHFMTTSKL